jgi:hypothetical protein
MAKTDNPSRDPKEQDKNSTNLNSTMHNLQVGTDR